MEDLNLDEDYFNYLLYSYQLSPEDGEDIIYQVKEDLIEGKINEFTFISKLEHYCNLQIINNEKEEKIRFLYSLLDSDDYFINNVKKQYKLNNNDVLNIAERVESDIELKNIPKYTIKRNFKKYAHENYFIKKNLKQLNDISSNLNNLFITKKLEKVKNISIEEVKEIISNLTKRINQGNYFTSNMQTVLTLEIEIASKNKKIQAQKQLSNFYEKSEESFENLLKHHNLTFEDKENLIKRLEALIAEGNLEYQNVKSELIIRVQKMGKEKKLNE